MYGGLIFAQLAHAVKQHTKFPLRRISVDMYAQVIAGDVSIQVTTARGVNSHFFYVSAQQNQKIVAHGTIVCGSPRCQILIDIDFLHLGNTPQFSLKKSDKMPAFSRFLITGSQLEEYHSANLKIYEQVDGSEQRRFTDR